jgi:hypothetical protein
MEGLLLMARKRSEQLQAAVDASKRERDAATGQLTMAQEQHAAAVAALNEVVASKQVCAVATCSAM